VTFVGFYPIVDKGKRMKKIKRMRKKPQLKPRLMTDLEKMKYMLENLPGFEEAMRLKPDESYYYVNRGDGYFEKGEMDLAIADYSKAIEMDSSFSISYYKRGMAYYVKGQLEKALADYKKANNMDSNLNTYIDGADMYKGVGRLDELLASYIEAMNILSSFKPK